MKKAILVLLSHFIALFAIGQCTTNNATDCACADGTTNCDLLPDLTISWDALENYSGGPTEYSQTGNGVENGRLRVTGSTPNIGFGPFTVRGTDYFLCGTDTIYDPTRSITTCPDNSYPTNLLIQRVYHKNGSTMTYTDRWAGGQTYHPGHGHNHVDDWVVFTLREEDPNEPDTLQWPIIGTGAKIGFCLMDLSNCNASNGHCRDNQTYGGGNILTSADFVNYGLGGGGYNCSPVEQGISVGYVDIYSENLEGMYINIPPGTCNGDYWIVVEVDPRNNFIESNENNNWTAVPFTLTKQVPQGQASADISFSHDPVLCNSSSITLTANPANSYVWSTGDTSASITISDTGKYYVDVNTQCGSARSDTVEITRLVSEVNTIIGDTLCEAGTATLFADGNGSIIWYGQSVGGSPVGNSNSYTTPSLTNDYIFYASNLVESSGQTSHVGPPFHEGTDYSSGVYNSHVEFNALEDFTLLSVEVETGFAGPRIIELRDNNGNVLQDTTVNIDTGVTQVGLNFYIPTGNDYQLGTNEANNQIQFGNASPNLKRSSSGVSYPYILTDVVALTGSPNGSSYYYYFYNWEVQTEGISCESPRVPVKVLVSEPQNVIITGLPSEMYESDTAITLSTEPTGGMLSGNGINGNIFDPQTTGVQDSVAITYTYTDSLGCQYSHIQYVKVLADTMGVGLTDFELLSDISLYPNPNKGTFQLHLGNIKQARVQVLNVLGELLHDKTLNNQSTHTITLKNTQAGLYLVRVNAAGQSKLIKVFVE